MTIEKLEIPLHDRSRAQVSGTDAGAIYLEVYGHFQPTGNRSEVDKLNAVPHEQGQKDKKAG